MPAAAAVTRALPLFPAVTRPSGATRATASFEDLHVTATPGTFRPLRSSATASSLPVAPPRASASLEGLTTRRVKPAGFTVTRASPLRPPSEAVTTARPGPTATTRPSDTAATRELDDDHESPSAAMAFPESSATLAASEATWPAASATSAGTTSMAAGICTTTRADPFASPKATVTTASPDLRAVTVPDPSTLATSGAELVQTGTAFGSATGFPSASRATARSAAVAPEAPSATRAGSTVTDFTEGPQARSPTAAAIALRFMGPTSPGACSTGAGGGQRHPGAAAVHSSRVPPLVLIVDDDPSNLDSLERILSREGWRVARADSGAAALEVLRRERVDVVVSDLMMPVMGGEDLLRATRAVSPETQVVLVTAYGTVEAAVSAMKEGAYDFITKPVKRHALVKAVRQALEKASLLAENRTLRERLAGLGREPEGGLLGGAPAFRAALDTLRQAAPSSASVLLMGESGTGKELSARLVHDLSPRAAGPFVPVSCSAIPESILESELFGYERGAFTGAAARKAGRFERAHGGTLFLDEVGEMSPAVQVKLLRVLQDGVVERLGGTQPVQVDVRIVAATNKDLGAEVKAGRFREDLFYRLDVVSVRLPPIRERREDVALLAHSFLRRFASENRKAVAGLSPAARAALEAYDWPGNVRELMHAIERAVVLSRGEVVELEDLPAPVQAARPGSAAAAPTLVIPVGTPLEEVERLVIRETLRHTRGDKTLAARILGVAARTIYRKLDRDESGRLVDVPGPGEE